MRTLSRPMFNMGGPIKQGIMHGIREPYRSAGVVKGIASKAGPIFKKAGEFFKGRTKGWFPSMPTRVIGKHGQQVNVPVKNTWGFTAPPRVEVKVGEDIIGKVPFKGNKWNWIKQFSKENPGYATVGAATALTAPNLAYKTVPSIAGAAGTVGKTWIDAVLPGDQSKWFTSEKIQEDLKPIVAGGAGGEEVITKDTSTAESRAAFAKSQQDARVKKYLDLMGYDRSKKTAIADALIDASKIVSDRGTLDRKNITGELINPLIQATSKRLDKPEQIREAVGLMMTKAGLEKEMYDAKPGTQLKAAQDYVSQFGGSMANAYKQLGLTKKGDFTESLGALSKQYGSKFDNQKVIIENIKFQKSSEPGFNIENIKVLGDADKLEELKEQEDFVSVSDAILRNPEAHKEIDGQLVPVPGIYVLGSTVLEVFEDGTHKRLN